MLPAVVLLLCFCFHSLHADESLNLRDEATTMKKAATYYREQVATHGGYVYFYSLDLKQRWGEGIATPNQIWVQPPGTPTVDMAYLKAWEATGDEYYLEAARAAAEGLAYGQLRTGGWTNLVDFKGRRQGDRYALETNVAMASRHWTTVKPHRPCSSSCVRMLHSISRMRRFINQPYLVSMRYSQRSFRLVRFLKDGEGRSRNSRC